MAGMDELRASDAERDQVVDRLRTALVEGRLTQDEFDDRVGVALAARTFGELVPVTSDLPPGPSRPLAVGTRPSGRAFAPDDRLQRASGRLPGALHSAFGVWLSVFALCCAIWAFQAIVGSGHHPGGFWPGWLLFWGFFTVRRGGPARHGHRPHEHHTHDQPDRPRSLDGSRRDPQDR